MREMMVIKWNYLETEPVFSYLGYLIAGRRGSTSLSPTKCTVIMSGQGRDDHCHDLPMLRATWGRFWDPRGGR